MTRGCGAPALPSTRLGPTAWRRGTASGRGLVGARDPEAQGRARAFAGTLGADPAAVPFDRPLGDREPDPDPRQVGGDGVGRPAEGFEDRLLRAGRQTDALVA